MTTGSTNQPFTGLTEWPSDLGRGDAWPDLPGRFRAAATAAGERGARQVFTGVAGNTAPWLPTRPLLVDRAHFDQLAAAADRLAQLILACCRRRARTAGELADRLAVSAERAPLLDRVAPVTDDLLIAVRPDVVYQAGVPRFVEFNVDGAVGGTLQADLVSARFLALYQEAALSGLAAPLSSVDARFAAIRAAAGRDARVVIPAFLAGGLPGLTSLDGFIAWVAPMCESARRHGLDTRAYPLDDLTVDSDGRLQAGEFPADIVFRLFLAAEQPPSPGLDALGQAIRAGTVTMHTAEASWLLGDKQVLAWLWADVDEMAGPDQDLVRRYLPWTACLTARTSLEDPLAARALRDRAHLVLKPAGGLGGRGVVLGPLTSEADWIAAVRGAARDGGYVLQEYVETDLAEISFVHRDTGERRTCAVPYVIGPFLFGHVACGGLARHGTPGGGAVVNAMRGAVISSLLLVDRAC